MTKRAKIEAMIAESVPLDNGARIITAEMFHRAGLYASLEDGRHSPDLSYAMRIANQLGYRTAVGLALHLYPRRIEEKP